MLYFFVFFFLSENQLKEAYTAEEKAKLYAAIGYQENEGDISLPKEVMSLSRPNCAKDVFTIELRDLRPSLDTFSDQSQPALFPSKFSLT